MNISINLVLTSILWRVDLALVALGVRLFAGVIGFRRKASWFGLRGRRRRLAIELLRGIARRKRMVEARKMSWLGLVNIGIGFLLVKLKSFNLHSAFG